jgi:hypothetical protein
MRYVVIGIGALLAAITATVEPSFAIEPLRPWCLEGGMLSRDPVDDCSYNTIEQCKASGGNGAAMCYPNRRLQWQALEQARNPPVPQRTTNRKRHHKAKP